MRTKDFFKGIVFSLLVAGLPLMAQGQPLREAVDAYNQGAQLIRDNPARALELLYKSLEISRTLGPDGEETRVLAESLIPRTHMELAMNLYRQNKMYETLAQLEKANETAIQFNDNATRARVDRIIPQLYNQLGNIEFRADSFHKAIDYYRKAIRAKEDYPDPLIGISLAFEALKDTESMLLYLRKAIDVATRVQDIAKADDARNKARGYLLGKGNDAQRAERFAEAIEHYTRALEFAPTDAAIHYMIAVSHISARQWDNALAKARLALQHNTNALDESNIYFQMGAAFQGMGNVREACAHFGRVTTGPFRDSAVYQMTHILRCE